MGSTGDGPTLAAAVEAAVAVLASNETAANHAEVALRVARQVEADTRQAHDEARRKAEGLQTEVRTLTNLLKAADNNLWPALVDQLKVERGYEAALGAALGDDIDASSDEGAPTHWRGLPPLEDGISLPGEAQPLSNFVQAPQALARRLSHIGVVSRALGQALQAQLRSGQRLVSREGDVWRWDGYTSAADAPNAAAKRLAERNRLSLLEVEMRDAAAVAAEAAQKFEAAKQSVEVGARTEREKREALRAATSSVEVSRQALAKHERQIAERLAQTSALDEGIRRISQSLDEVRASFEAAQAEFQAIPVLEGLAQEVAALRDNVNRERAAYAEARAKHDGLEREAKARAERLATLEAERNQWSERAKRATEQIEHLTTRAQETREAIAELAGMPQILADKRRTLMNLLQEAETERKAAADALAEGENAVRAADQILREAQELASTSREDHARFEARLEASKQRHADSERRIAETLQCAPSEIVANAGLDLDKIEDTEHIERRLLSLREDRERLGGVNLRAEEEAETVATQLATLIRERDDLVQAINKLRGGISSLNREGRQRLLDAFGTVNEKFGGARSPPCLVAARRRLQLIESDDPLEAGLEILANPPGKKPTVLSLLSGGEQTLTALALIFAVFLTNPSPICVLDEVDAPLDDHNVERFCNLLDAMLERTETRFLIITHHELTMSRMDRLFGVTMMERGVSQLVSGESRRSRSDGGGQLRLRTREFMLKALPKPQQRSPLRMALGKTWFIAKRRVQWYLPGRRYATTRSSTLLPHQHASHRTPLLRQLKGVDMWLQHNKVESLKVAASCIDGLLLRPGETFSFWRLVGRPTAKRGFKTGMCCATAQWRRAWAAGFAR